MSVAQSQGSAPCRFRGQHPTVTRPARDLSERHEPGPAVRDVCGQQRGVRPAAARACVIQRPAAGVNCRGADLLASTPAIIPPQYVRAV
jgi:hypothetical protein